MRTILFTILLLGTTLQAMAADVLIVDDKGNIGAYRRSVNTPDYDNGTNLINPDLSNVKDVAKKFWKIDKNQVIEMSQAEKDTILAAEVAAAQASQNAADDELQVTLKEAFVAWLELYNAKVPIQYRVTKSEMVQKVRDNR